MITTCQTCWTEAVRVTAAGYLHRHTDQHTGRQCRGSGDLASVPRRPPVRGANRRPAAVR